MAGIDTAPVPAITYAFAVIIFLVIVVRLLFRKLKNETFKPDDYLICFAYLFYLGDAVSTVIIVSPPSQCSHSTLTQAWANWGTNVNVKDPKKLHPEQIHEGEFSSIICLSHAHGYKC